MQSVTLPATSRKHLGTKHTRRLRQQGKLPAIIYGHGETPEPVTIDAHEMENALHHHSRVIELNVDSKKGQYLIKAIQYDHLQSTPIHMDLMRVDADEKVTVKIEIQLRGTPAGASDGGVLTQLINDLEIECMVTAIPESLRPTVTSLGVDEALTVGDLELPDGVTALLDPAEKVAICRVPTEEEEVEETVEGEEESTAQPEIIGRPKEESAE